MNYNTNKSGLVLLGDIHGDWQVIEDFCKNYSDFCILQVGDFGIGFKHKLKEQHKLEKLSQVLTDSNNELYVIRGNHDDPRYFTGVKDRERPKVILLQDYSTLRFQNTVIQTIGGAISIDRSTREIDRSYWLDEEVRFYPDRVQKVDVLVTHSAPGVFPLTKGDANPAVKHFISLEARQGGSLDQDIKQEQKIIQELSDLSQCRVHYFGHFHKALTHFEAGRKYVCLDINEFKELSYN